MDGTSTQELQSNWKNNGQSCSTLFSGRTGDFSTQFLHHQIIHNVHSQARPTLRLLRREKGVEDARQYFRRDSSAIVGIGDGYLVAWGLVTWGLVFYHDAHDALLGIALEAV